MMQTKTEFANELEQFIKKIPSFHLEMNNKFKEMKKCIDAITVKKKKLTDIEHSRNEPYI